MPEFACIFHELIMMQAMVSVQNNTYLRNKNTRVMTTKLTLTIEASVVADAKKYAASKGKSLSKLVQNYLKTITEYSEDTDSISPKITKLMGSAKSVHGTHYKESLSESLRKKYKL
jgi:hypothetical protein